MTFLSIFTLKFQVGVAYMSELLPRHLTKLSKMQDHYTRSLRFILFVNTRESLAAGTPQNKNI